MSGHCIGIIILLLPYFNPDSIASSLSVVNCFALVLNGGDFLEVGYNFYYYSFGCRRRVQLYFGRQHKSS